MTVAHHFLFGIAHRATQRTLRPAAPPSTGAIDGQADEATVVKRLVALGPTDHAQQGGPCGCGLQALGEVAQSLVPKPSGPPQSPAYPGTHQLLHGRQTRLAQQTADQQRPHQQFGVGGPHFPYRVLKLTARLDAFWHLLDHLFGDVLHLFV
ncbi:MAG TPA: hypothetical protein VN648_30380, partial [Candidatus Methylomirabilis sp.]|nr:hypothetical protein [Candidatus Methylomirabilis sp.]